MFSRKPPFSSSSTMDSLKPAICWQSSGAGASVSTAGASAGSAGHGAEWHLLSQPEVETGPMARLRKVFAALVPGENALAELRGVTAP